MNHSLPLFISVIVDGSLGKCLEYEVPTQFLPIERGQRVEIPVKGSIRKGFIYKISHSKNFPKVLPIHSILKQGPKISEDLLLLAEWMAEYYCSSLDKTLQMILPAPVRKGMSEKKQYWVSKLKSWEELRSYCEKIQNKASSQAAVLEYILSRQTPVLLTELLEKANVSRSPVDSLAKSGFLLLQEQRIDRSPIENEEYFKTKPKKLNPEQQIAVNSLIEALKKECFSTYLLSGITGSGKTEVYLQTIDAALQKNLGVILLVPEVSLTAQTVERFRSRFDQRIAILHHRLSEGERFDEWNRMARGEAKIAVGARSAIFSPISNLGLIIVDEEHESSYKQSDSSPCYHARDVAVMRGKMTQSVVVLGSATPSLESYYNINIGKYHLLSLNHRASSHSHLPEIEVVDMRQERLKAKRNTCFSEALLNGIQERMGKGEQTILFLNRRGYFTSLCCQSCGKSVECNHCDITMTFHKNAHILSCHYCGFTTPPLLKCPHCFAEATMKYRGIGTEHVEMDLHAIFPEIRTLRVDADTTKHKGSHQQLLRSFGNGKADVLIGTQMISKGLHFPQVTLVGIINADSSLNIPDFRASELTFQTLVQVSGRAGRGEIKGKIILQTYLPENSTIQLSMKQDYLAFYQQETEVRQLFEYPPFSSLAKVLFSGPEEEKTQTIANHFHKLLLEHLPSKYQIYPPLPPGHKKIKDKFRFQILMKGPSSLLFAKAIKKTLKEIDIPSSIHVLVDINPLSTY